MPSLSREEVNNARAWPMQEALRLLDNLHNKTPAKGYVLFESGYGPSGLPHIGTFGEVARTTMVRRAFKLISDIPTRFFSFSDDMDGLRKVPGNLPNQAMLIQHIGKPLTAIPDPFGTHDSFGAHMNARLRGFLDNFGFDYEFVSATECYRSGMFDQTLLQILAHYDEIMSIMLPSLGEERQETYSPFLPICPETGVVLQVPMEKLDPQAGTITYRNSNGKLVETPVTGGHCKMQWKADWAMRWVALDVDYEMYGKDLIPSADLSSKITKVLAPKLPMLFTYEHFLDQEGRKISKSKGNGLTIDEWLTYAPTESLAFYMYQSPRKAKRLSFDVIPRQTDDYLQYMQKYVQQTEAERLENPLLYMGFTKPELTQMAVFNYSMLLNLVSVCNPDSPEVLWGFITHYDPSLTRESAPLLNQLVPFAMRYYEDFVRPLKQYYVPTEPELAILLDLQSTLLSLPSDMLAADVQNQLYDFARKHGLVETKTLFMLVYRAIFGQQEGPRLGSFFAIYGTKESAELFNRLKEHSA